MQNALKSELSALADEKRAAFSLALIPNSAPILGIKSEDLKKTAKRIARGNFGAYLACAEDTTHEEICLQALIISYAVMDLDVRLKYIEGFIPKIKNWAVCDTFCSALRPVIKKNQAEFWEFIKPYLYSDEEFKIRFGAVMILVGFVSEEYAARAFEIFDTIKRDGYYAMMAAAWALAEFYVKLPEITLSYLLNNRLDDTTYNKALQKICESKRVNPEAKQKIRAMKRKQGKI